jgi:plasmid stability protein
MLNTEKILKDLNLRIARFGDTDVANVRSILPREIHASDARRLRRQIAAKLGFKIE